ncbi:MAG: Branched-chain amino acid ABC transporter, amino acid-binding protein [Candidatus Ozemobacter sibiricus]|jgi:branched-chain amino acid transport system substrate-binding protein|uniref:Branched-chain amino acid ABC transporter, amino acid-binding protein n=1 Tax=Candidatus Ozemobacter sibiricus TaxID=2268124 RepID=A0A367Z806_9BACT|nr:MAG: Branched-chain amino acid ABC transporter, amino acid-binding protein [Candidatus Ozemobacter sibiricus]
MRRFAICLMVVALALTWPGMAPAAAEEKVLKIGTLFPLTGPCALAGQRCKAAVETAAEVINGSHPEMNIPLATGTGVLGYRIELVHADSQGKPEVGKAEAERLIDQEGVWAIIGCYNSAVTKPASFVAERKKRLFLAGSSSSAALTERNLKLFFRLAPTDRTESHAFAEFLERLNAEKGAAIKTVGLIYENTEFGKHAADEAKIALTAKGFTVTADVPFSPGATNLNSEVTTLKAAAPDALLGACLGGDYTLLVRTMKQQGWVPRVALNYCSGYQDPEIARQLGPDADFFAGCTGYSPDFAALMPEVGAVEKLFSAKTKVPYDADSIQETVALLVLAQAIEQAGGPDTEKVATVLRSTEFVSPLSLGGKVAFDAQGQNIRATSLITQLQGGVYKRVHPAAMATGELVFPIPPWDQRQP